MANLQDDLNTLFQGDLTNGDIDLGKFFRIPKMEKMEKLYNSYNRSDVCWGLNEKTKKKLENGKPKELDWNIRELKPFVEEFYLEKFWFKNTKYPHNPYKELTTQEDAVVAFKDGVNTVFYKGEYLDGGSLYSESVKTNKSTTVNNSLTGEVGTSNGNSEYYEDFIYAYFPPKLYLSPYSKNYYILTQGKNLLRNREQPVIRFYFNFKSENINYTNITQYIESVEYFKSEINKFINDIEKELNKLRVPFQFKVPTSLENFQRADTFVLYVAQNHFYYLYEFIKNHSDKYKHILGKDLPLFVSPFDNVEGVGIAEDPSIEGESYGSNRCELIYSIIEKLSKQVATQNSIPISSVINELDSQGYKSNNFFKNPNTGFDYLFRGYNKVNLEDTFGTTYPPNTRYYLPEYGKVALNYALDLIERAIWLNSEEITWITYYEENIDGIEEKGYRLITDEESQQIFWFLYQILRFKWMREFFSEHLIHIIVTKQVADSDLKKNPKYLDKVFKNFEDTKKAYSDLTKDIYQYTKEIDIYLESSEKKWFNKIGTIFKKVSLDIPKLDEIIKNVNDYWVTILSLPEGSLLPPIYGLNKGNFVNTPGLTKNIRKIYHQYVKPLYPIKNAYGNYEYCPTNKGKLQIGMIMLFVYCPSLFPKKFQQQVSSP
jgi:HopA1 effector protein family